MGAMSATIISPEKSAAPLGSVPPKRRLRPRRFLWNLEIYHRAIDAGVFENDPHVELLNGELIRTVPENPPHVIALELAHSEAARVFGLLHCHVRTQHPITVPPNSEPEPDICVVKGSIRDYTAKHPAPDDIYLLIEISYSTLAYDRTIKARIYTRAGIAEYWILNVSERCLEVYRSPRSGAYPDPVIYDETMSLLPLNAPPSAVPILIADLLP